MSDWPRCGERRKVNNDLNQIMARLNSIDISIGVLGNKVENLHSKINSQNGDVKERLEKHDHTLYGNGKPGLTHHVNRIDDLDGKINFHIMTDRWFYSIVIGLLGWALIRLYTLPR